jgi:PAS domain S-box-containing protein
MKKLSTGRRRELVSALNPRESQVLEDDLARIRRRICALQARCDQRHAGDPVVLEAFGELQSALEELSIAQQELHDQNAQLREAWAAMHTERIRYLSLFHGMPDAYFVTSAHGQIQEANEPAAKLLNRSIGYLIGKPLAVYVPSGDRGLLRKNLAHCLATGASLSWDSKVQTREHVIVPVEFRVIMSAADVQREQKLYWLLRDIRERRAAQQRLVQAERLAAIGQMVTGLTHESRNALQRSQACLSMLRLEVKGNPEADGLLDRLRAAQQRLVHLYEQVRTFAAPLHQQIEGLNLVEILQQALSDLLFVHPDRVVRLLLKGKEALPAVAMVDRVAISQVFTNILENSITAGSDPVVIEFDWSEIESAGRQFWGLRLRDNGPGLSEEEARRLFEPFFTTKVRGTGLGMSIVRRLVESHGGTIAVGRMDGPGTELIISLPR